MARKQKEKRKTLTFWALQAAANGRMSCGCAAWRSRRQSAHIAILQRAQYRVNGSPLWSLQTGVVSVAGPREPLPPFDCQLPRGGPRLWAAKGPLFGWQDSLQPSQYNTWNKPHDPSYSSLCPFSISQQIFYDVCFRPSLLIPRSRSSIVCIRSKTVPQHGSTYLRIKRQTNDHEYINRIGSSTDSVFLVIHQRTPSLPLNVQRDSRKLISDKFGVFVFGTRGSHK